MRTPRHARGRRTSSSVSTNSCLPTSFPQFVDGIAGPEGRNPFYFASALNTGLGMDATRALLRFARRTDAAIELELGALS